MEIDKYRVIFSMKLNPKVVKKAALRYPDKTVIEAFSNMGILNVDEMGLGKDTVEIEKRRYF